jgi:hypothetical protein
MAQSNNITVIVVVGGFDQPVTININEQVKSLVKEALRESGQPKEPPENWVLRSAAGGEPIGQDQKIRDVAGIVPGVKLFLNQHTGGGG